MNQIVAIILMIVLTCVTGGVGVYIAKFCKKTLNADWGAGWTIFFTLMALMLEGAILLDMLSALYNTT